MQEAQSIIIGISSGIGGALAAVTAFLIAFRSLEKSVETTQQRLSDIEDALETKIDGTACDKCHRAFEAELARGTKHFDDLFASQQATVEAMGRVDTSVQLLVQRTEAMERVISRVTRIEVRLPTDPEPR